MSRRIAGALAVLALLVGGVAGGVILGLNLDDDTRVLGIKITGDSGAAAEAALFTFPPFKTFCNEGPVKPDDPIVKFGQPGASHPHQSFGVTTFSASSTLANSVGDPTTCDIPEDSAGYWGPLVYVDGVEETPIGHAFPCPVAFDKCGKGITGWYSDGGGVDFTWPADFRMIAGDATASGPCDTPLIKCDGSGNVISSNITYNCYGEQKSIGKAPPECEDLDPTTRLDFWLTFPRCWNGTQSDSPDHRSHVAYPDKFGACPTSHPWRLPRLVVQINYRAFNGSAMTLAGPGPGDTAAPWYTIHFDFANWWVMDGPGGLIARTAPPPPGVPSPTSSPSPIPTPTPTRTR